jgi:septal ring factor EnvC (AmiA/AmiB activator)
MVDARLEQQLAQIEAEIDACVLRLKANWAARAHTEHLTGRFEARHLALRARIVELSERKVEIERELNLTEAAIHGR